MKQKSILLGLVMGLTLASQDTQSLGMGKIQVHSALDQPLQASIDLMMGDSEDLSNLTVQLASAADYKKVGLDRSFVPSNITVALDEDNPLIIKVTSSGPVSEPIVTLLLDVNWGNGRIFREFTILLDPPAYSSSQITSTAPVSESTYQAPEPSEAVEDATEPAVEPVVQTRAEADESVVDEESTYQASANANEVEVLSGDTLWSIANQNKPSSLTTNQMMAALFNHNPQAFANNNINQLIKGSRLMIPTANELQSISQAEALDLVQAHNDSWVPAQQSVDDSYSSFQTTEPAYEAPTETQSEGIDYGVELAGSTDQEDSNGGQEGGGYENLNETAVAEELYNKDSENADLKERLSELEGIVEQQQAALEIKSDDLANLEDQLSEPVGESDDAIQEAIETDDVWGDDASVALNDEGSTTEDESMAEVDAPVISDVTIDVPEDSSNNVDDTAATDEAPAQDKKPTPSFSGNQSQEESMVDKAVNWAMENLQWLAIGLLGLLVLIFVPKFLRSRDKDVAEETSFLDDIKSSNKDSDYEEDVAAVAEDTKINDPLVEEVTEPVDVEDDVLADLDKKIDFESEDDDEDIFKGFDDEPVVESESTSDENESSDDGFDLDGFLNDDERNESEETQESEPLLDVSDDEEEDFDFDLSELDDLEETAVDSDAAELNNEIDDALDSLGDDAEEVVEKIGEAAEAAEETEFSIDEDFEFDLEGEMEDLAEGAEDAMEELNEDTEAAFDEVLDITDETAESLEVETEATDEDIDLGLDLDDMLEDGDVIDTKLDLAKAYLEMGDHDGAKNLLKEVSAEGNDSQIEAAKKLLDDM